MTTDDPRIRLATDLFAAWSSGDIDAPAPFLHDDAVLDDIVGGAHHGWPAIREFFGYGLARFPDLTLIPDQFWTSDDGVALSWVMSASVTDATAARFGVAHVGARWSSRGMTWLRIVDGKVAHEVDYHDSGAPAASLATAVDR